MMKRIIYILACLCALPLFSVQANEPAGATAGKGKKQKVMYEV
jgi:hypothetical protein